MNQKIDWMLFNDDKLLLCRKDVLAYYEYNNKIIYQTDKEKNMFSYEKNIFKRVTDELYMEINFNEKTCKFDFGKDGNCKFDLECSNEITPDEVIITYKIDDSVKKIVIKLKDIKL